MLEVLHCTLYEGGAVAQCGPVRCFYIPLGTRTRVQISGARTCTRTRSQCTRT